MSDEEYLSYLNYDNFVMVHACYGEWHDKTMVEVKFSKLNNEDFYRETLVVSADLPEGGGIDWWKSIPEICSQGDSFYINVYLPSLTIDFLPITMSYTNINGEQVNKEFILDFTQKSFVREYVENLNPNWKCSCGSGKKYKDCCRDEWLNFWIQ